MAVLDKTPLNKVNSPNLPLPVATLTLDSVLSQHPDQVATEVDGEVLMMNVDSGNYYGLNEVASFVWNTLAEPTTVRDLCTAIYSEFDVERERCETDTLVFLQNLFNDGLVKLTHPNQDPNG